MPDLVNTEAAVSVQNIHEHDKLLAEMPSIDVLQEMANETQTTFKEDGVSVLKLSDKSIESVYTKSAGTSIYEPTPPLDLKGKIKSGVFIHFHPIMAEEEVSDGRSLHILPSGHDFMSGGDISASYWSRVISGYLNIGSKYGLTMFIGSEGISRDDYILREAQKRAGSKDIAKQTTWKILTGDNAGTAFIDRESEYAITNKFSIKEDKILFSQTEGTNTRYFLHLSWEKLREFESVYGGLENLFFGDGMKKLGVNLKMDVFYEDNLGKAAGNFYKMPKSRNEI